MTATITIVGRTNVGKSTLFNRLTGKKRALVNDRPGVTRDRREGDATLYTYPFKLIDTAGLEQNDALQDLMWKQTEKAIQQADVILFLVDVRTGITPLDKEAGKKLRKANKTVILVANKSEGFLEPPQELYALGFGTPVLISAEHGLGMGDLFEVLKEYIVPEETDKSNEKKEVVFSDELIDIAIVGRPNVGKSTLINRIIGENRLLAGPMAGLTRDAISINWEYHGKKIRLTDTAGLRRHAKITDDLEKLSAADTRRSILLSHVVVLLLDADGILDKQDLTIARQVIEEGRALIIAVNKWDIVSNKKERISLLNERIESSLTQIKDIKTLTISARTGEGLDLLMKAILDIYAIWNTRISTGKLNRWLAEMIATNPPPLSATKRPIPLKYITQIKTRPPTFALFSSNPEKLPESYLRYLIKGLSSYLKIGSVPIRILMKKANNPYENKKKRR